MKRPYKLWISLLSTLLLASAIAGCAVPRGVEPSFITMHTWRQLKWKPTEPWQGPTSALYTYVLVGEGASTGGAPDAERARAALKRLLQLIEESPAVSSADAPFPREMHDLMNQFCVPTKREVSPDSDVGLDRYDFKLAQSYRQWFQVIAAKDPKLDDAVLNGSGPYLVAARKPLGTLIADNDGTQVVTADSPVLIIDMSKGSEASVPYYLDAFKAAVRVARPDSAALVPMKPTIVEYLAKTNQAIPLLEEMWSQSKKLFVVKA